MPGVGIARGRAWQGVSHGRESSTEGSYWGVTMASSLGNIGVNTTTETHVVAMVPEAWKSVLLPSWTLAVCTNGWQQNLARGRSRGCLWVEEVWCD